MLLFLFFPVVKSLSSFSFSFSFFLLFLLFSPPFFLPPPSFFSPSLWEGRGGYWILGTRSWCLGIKKARHFRMCIKWRVKLLIKNDISALLNIINANIPLLIYRHITTHSVVNTRSLVVDGELYLVVTDGNDIVFW